jgi:hypothetical protein
MTMPTVQYAAINKQPPRGAGTGHANAPLNTAIAASSTTAQVLATLLTDLDLCWVTFSADVDCYVRFGNSAASIGAATTSDLRLVANQSYEWRFDKDCNFVSVLQKTTGGTLTRYRSS